MQPIQQGFKRYSTFILKEREMRKSLKNRNLGKPTNAWIILSILRNLYNNLTVTVLSLTKHSIATHRTSLNINFAWLTTDKILFKAFITEKRVQLYWRWSTTLSQLILILKILEQSKFAYEVLFHSISIINNMRISKAGNGVSCKIMFRSFKLVCATS